MQTLLGADAERNAADIAHHLQLAGTAAPRETTLDFLEHAARNALAAVAPEDAIRHVGAALHLLGDRHEARRAELLAIQARAHRGRHISTTRVNDLAGALVLAPAGPAHDAILRQRAGLFLDLFDGQAAAADLESVLAAARARSDRAAELDTLLALGRAHYVRALDDQEFAHLTPSHLRGGVRARGRAGRPQGDDRIAPAHDLVCRLLGGLRTRSARANIEEAGRLADEVGDEQLSLEVEAASLRFVRGPEAAALGERLRERLEAGHDPVRLKEHYFWLMWHYLGRGELLRCVETCDLGIELARQLGSAPVQYGSIKALALTELGRYDLVDAVLDEEVTDDEHPFGQANQAFAASYLGAIEAWEPAAVAALDAMQRGAALSRVWMQQGMLTVATSLRARARDGYGRSDGGDRYHRRRQQIRPTALARAEVELAEGRVSGAREELERVVGPLTTNDLRRDLTHALELLAVR